MQKHAHVIGIGGVLMSAAAKLLQDQGYTVTGSDEAMYPPVSTYLERLKISVHEGYRSENIQPNTSLIVLGRSAKLDPKTNQEVQAALKSGAVIKSATTILAEASQSSQRRIVVAGSFGKSTTAALLAWILEHAGKHPGYFVGAFSSDLHNTAAVGNGTIFVLEGDEYPTAHMDPRAKFLQFAPNDVLLTSLVHDHVNIYPTVQAYISPFRELVQKLTPSGLLVRCIDNQTDPIVSDTPARVVTYSLQNQDADWYATNCVPGKTTTFTLMHHGRPFLRNIETQLLGTHNIQNIVGASAYLFERDLVTPDQFVAALANFRGVERRLDLKTHASRVPCYEGFGSSDRKAQAAIEAVRWHYPDRRLIVVFEPHTFSWRSRAMLSWYDTSFQGASRILVYHAGLAHTNSDEVSLEEIVERLSVAGIQADGYTVRTELLAQLPTVVTEEDVVLLLTSGPMGGLVRDIPIWLDTNFS